jgi:phage gp36-like protein
MGSQYCAPPDLIATGVNPLALVDVETSQQVTVCVQASAIADDYMRGRYALPLSAWGQSLTYRVAQVAVWMLLNARGRNPAAGPDIYWRQEYEDAIEWFRGVQRQSVHPDVTPAVAQPGDPVHDLPQVHTSPQRGWEEFGGGRPSVS